MTIEFNCEHCSHFLTTGDDKAGLTAKCPGCGEEITIPAAPVTEPATPDSGADPGYQQQTVQETGDFAPPPPAPAPAAIPPGLDVGEVVTTTWTIYKDKMGLVLGGVLIALIIQQMAAVPASIAQQFMGAEGVDDGTRLIAAAGWFVFQIITWLVQMYMTCGTTLLLLNVVKGRPAEITDIFKGGAYFGRMLLCSFIVGIMVFLGTLACIVPGVIIGLMFFPFVSVLVDRDAPGLDALWQAKDLTNGHKGSLFLLMMAMFGIQLLGLMACCVGMLFTTPLVGLMGTVAYMRMSGQQTIAG